MMKNDDRAMTDAQVSLGSNASMKTTSTGALEHLSELKDFRVAEGEPDIRGWDVRTSDRQKVGEVEDLLVDTAEMKVRYIEVKLARDLARAMSAEGDSVVTDGSKYQRGAKADLSEYEELSGRRNGGRDDDAGRDNDGERYVLVPIGVARLDDEDDDVLLDARAAQMAGIPAYSRQGLTREFENDVVRGYDRAGNADSRESHRDILAADAVGAHGVDGFYAGRDFDDRAFRSGRREAGRDSYLHRSSDRAAGLDADADAQADGAVERTTQRRTLDRELMDSPSDPDARIEDPLDRR